jgi:hypothetical protein
VLTASYQLAVLKARRVLPGCVVQLRRPPMSSRPLPARLSEGQPRLSARVPARFPSLGQADDKVGELAFAGHRPSAMAGRHKAAAALCDEYPDVTYEAT